MKIAIVVQRYGDEVIGGAEKHARWIAERLVRNHDVQVLTTCAIDYLSWENEYDPGETTLGGIPVHRFPVKRRRTREDFDALSEKVHFFSHSDSEERAWMEAHGPVTPKLISYLEETASSYDVIIFFCYRYWTTYHGLKVAPEKSILVPTAEHDRAIHMRIFKALFQRPAAIAFNSVEEKNLILGISRTAELPGEVVGVGIENEGIIEPQDLKRRLDVLGDYVIYVGRIERAKGCARMFADFSRYVRERNPHLNLVLVGNEILPIPTHVNISHLGVLPDSEKLTAIGASRLLLQPSPYESLSMVLLEAWKMGRPALVNGQCEVLRGQVIRGGGGLYYSTYEEFAEGLDWMLSQREKADAMGRSGREYFQDNYSWDVIMEKYDRLLAMASRSKAQSPRPARELKES